MSSLHSLLSEQIFKYYPDYNIPEDFAKLIFDINESYIDFERENKKLRQELELGTKEYYDSLNTIESLQGQMVQSEKTAALDRLIAGIAHEINTPIGAIKASNNNTRDFINRLLDDYPIIIKRLNGEQEELFTKLIKESNEKETSLTSREERGCKRLIKESVEQNTIFDRDDIVTLLVEMGICDNVLRYLPLLQEPDSMRIIQTANDISNLYRSYKNINMAIDCVSKIIFALKNYVYQNNKEDMTFSNVINSKCYSCNEL